MNTPSNAIPEPSRESLSPAAISETRRMYWSMRRELWENRSIYIAPLAVAALVLVGFLIATIGRAIATRNLAQRQAVLEEPYTFAMGVILLTAFIVSIVYSLDALHGERRDRSILFWKSLPVSDFTTVLSKASVPLVVLPLFSFVVVVATEWVMVVLSTTVLLGSGLSVAKLWTDVSLSQTMLLYHLVTVHMLWYAPIYAWLLLVSAWARRAPVLWAALPLFAIGIVERMAFHTSRFAALLQWRFMGGPEGGAMTGAVGTSMFPAHITPGTFLSSPGLWIGLAVAAAFLFSAVRLRRSQGPL
jgi:ABC-2 type transport system permease protein